MADQERYVRNTSIGPIGVSPASGLDARAHAWDSAADAATKWAQVLSSKAQDDAKIKGDLAGTHDGAQYDEDGNLKPLTTLPSDISAYSNAYRAAALAKYKVAALDDADVHFADLARQHEQDPEAFRGAANDYIQETLKAMHPMAADEVSQGLHSGAIRTFGQLHDKQALREQNEAAEAIDNRASTIINRVANDAAQLGPTPAGFARTGQQLATELLPLYADRKRFDPNFTDADAANKMNDATRLVVGQMVGNEYKQLYSKRIAGADGTQAFDAKSAETFLAGWDQSLSPEMKALFSPDEIDKVKSNARSTVQGLAASVQNDENLRLASLDQQNASRISGLDDRLRQKLLTFADVDSAGRLSRDNAQDILLRSRYKDQIQSQLDSANKQSAALVEANGRWQSWVANGQEKLGPDAAGQQITDMEFYRRTHGGELVKGDIKGIDEGTVNLRDPGVIDAGVSTLARTGILPSIIKTELEADTKDLTGEKLLGGSRLLKALIQVEPTIIGKLTPETVAAYAYADEHDGAVDPKEVATGWAAFRRAQFETSPFGQRLQQAKANTTPEQYKTALTTSLTELGRAANWRQRNWDALAYGTTAGGHNILGPDQVQGGITWALTNLSPIQLFSGSFDPNSIPVPERMSKDFNDLYIEELAHTGNETAARRRAMDKVGAKWNTSSYALPDINSGSTGLVGLGYTEHSIEAASGLDSAEVGAQIVESLEARDRFNQGETVKQTPDDKRGGIPGLVNTIDKSLFGDKPDYQQLLADHKLGVQWNSLERAWDIYHQGPDDVWYRDSQAFLPSADTALERAQKLKAAQDFGGSPVGRAAGALEKLSLDTREGIGALLSKLPLVKTDLQPQSVTDLAKRVEMYRRFGVNSKMTPGGNPNASR